jgi:hypothetical protein
MDNLLLSLLQAIIFSIVPFITLLVISFVFRVFAREEFPMWMGVFLGLAFVGEEMTDIVGVPSAGLVLKIFSVMIFSAWAIKFGNRFASKLPSHELGQGGYHLLRKSISKVKGRRFVEIVMPRSADIENIYGKKPVSLDMKKEIGGKKFVLPADLPIEILEKRIVRRLVTDWRIGDAIVKLDGRGNVVKLAISAKKTRISNIIPKGWVLFSFRPESIPFELGYGDSVDVVTKTFLVKAVEVLNVDNGVISTIMKPKDAEKLAGMVADGIRPSVIVYPHIKAKSIGKKIL